MLLDQTAGKCSSTMSPTKRGEDKGEAVGCVCCSPHNGLLLCQEFKCGRRKSYKTAQSPDGLISPLSRCSSSAATFSPRNKKKVEIGPKSPVAAESLLSAQLPSKYPVKLHLILSPALLQKRCHLISFWLKCCMKGGGGIGILHTHLKAPASCHISCLMSRFSKMQRLMPSHLGHKKRPFQKTSFGILSFI